MLYTIGLFVGIEIIDDDVNCIGRYCFPDYEDALRALRTWNGEGDPPGDWIKYKGTGGEYSRLEREY